MQALFEIGRERDLQISDFFPSENFLKAKRVEKIYITFQRKQRLKIS